MTRVVVDRIAAGGEGVGRLPDGRVVFVSRAAPGDEVEVALREERPRFARGDIASLVRTSPERVDPPCPHYVRDCCGGCQVQHLQYSAQLEAKRRIAGDALRRIGGRALEDPPIVPAPEQWRYRTRITLAAVPRPGAAPVIGLHRAGAPDRVFPLVDCLISAPALMTTWTRLRPLGHLLPEDLEGLVLRLDREGGMHVVVLGGTPPWSSDALVSALGEPQVSLWWRPREGAARVVAGPRRGFPALAFEQVNPALAATIRDDAVQSLGSVKDRVVWDLYGGVGDAARALAGLGARVFSVDADQSALEWARTQPVVGDGSISYVAERVENALRRLPEPDAVLANPPRTGLDQRVTRWLQDWAAARPGSARLSYVSCDPATLARDLKRMPALLVRQVRAYDLFPQTAHVECLAVLEAA